MTVHHNDSEIIIDDPEYFFQYCSWPLCGNDGNTLHATTVKVSTIKPDVVSKSYAFTNIKLLTYILPIKCNVQILNIRKSPANVFYLVTIKHQKQALIYYFGYNII